MVTVVALHVKKKHTVAMVFKKETRHVMMGILQTVMAVAPHANQKSIAEMV
jgi:hypothetical protein